MAITAPTGESTAKLIEMVRQLGVAMLTTSEPDGTMRSRPMHVHIDQDDSGRFDGMLWFFTEERSGKIFEIAQDRHVNLSLSCPRSQSYVSLSGRARMVDDRDRAERLWSPAYKAWFPSGLDDPNLTLIRVDLDKGEYWDAAPSTVVHAVGYLKATLTGEAYEPPGDHRKVDF